MKTKLSYCLLFVLACGFFLWGFVCVCVCVYCVVLGVFVVVLFWGSFFFLEVGLTTCFFSDVIFYYLTERTNILTLVTETKVKFITEDLIEFGIVLLLLWLVRFSTCFSQLVVWQVTSGALSTPAIGLSTFIHFN